MGIRSVAGQEVEKTLNIWYTPTGKLSSVGLSAANHLRSAGVLTPLNPSWRLPGTIGPAPTKVYAKRECFRLYRKKNRWIHSPNHENPT